MAAVSPGGSGSCLAPAPKALWKHAFVLQRPPWIDGWRTKTGLSANQRRKIRREETAHHIRLGTADGCGSTHGSRARAGQEAQHR